MANGRQEQALTTLDELKRMLSSVLWLIPLAFKRFDIGFHDISIVVFWGFHMVFIGFESCLEMNSRQHAH